MADPLAIEGYCYFHIVLERGILFLRLRIIVSILNQA